MKYLSMDELKTLLRSVPADKPWQRTMFLVMYWHGLRISETVGERGLRGRDIQHGHVNIVRLKGSFPTLQLYVKSPDPELDESEALARLALTVPENENVFKLSVRGVQDLMKRIGKRSGLNHFKMHPHILKHTHAMHQVKAGVDITSIRETLGHKSLASTGFYTRIAQDDAMATFAKAMGGSV